MGGPLNFVIVITNIGTGACPGPIWVVDGLPSGISPQQVTPPTACAINGNTVQCAFPGPLNPNASLTVTIHSTVKQGPVVNCASVETTGDLNAANNRSCVEVPVATPTKPPTPTLTPTSTPVRVCEALPRGEQSLDTGVDANGDGKDDRWTFVSGPSGTPGPAPIIPPNGAWDTLPGTQWLSGDPTGPNGTYIYRLMFCLPREVKEVRLSLQVLSDDIAQVYVNGNPVAATPPIPPCPGANQYCFKNPPSSFNLSVAASSLAPFVPGALNILEIRVQNTYGVVTGFDAAGVVYWQ